MAEFTRWWVDRNFLYVGRIAIDKGLAVIIRAWLRLAQYHGVSCPSLWIAGGHPSEIDRFRAGSGLAESIVGHERNRRIHWWGYLDASGISTLLLKALALITHSRYEPGGRTVLEAMTEGVPVIGTPYGFASDLVRDWTNGFLVPYGDEELLARRMDHFVRQPLLRNCFGGPARAAALGALDEWRFLDAHERIYELAAGRETPSSQPSVSPPVQEFEAFQRRRIVPTYPFSQPTPSIERVSSFVSEAVGEPVRNIRSLVSAHGSSKGWQVRCASTEWHVKWPYTRLSIRPLWDARSNAELAIPAHRRYCAEVRAAGLPGFAPLVAADDGEHLLLRLWYQPLPIDLRPENIAQAICPLRELYSEPLQEELNGLRTIDRSWTSAPQDDVEDAKRLISQCFNNSTEPWNPCRPVSLRLAWRDFEIGLRTRAIELPDVFEEDPYRTTRLFAELAECEANRRPVICHGSADLNHVVLTGDGRSLLIDGENIHPAWPGEDIAALILCAINDTATPPDEYVVWSDALNAVAGDEEERALLASWTAFLTMEDLCRDAALVRTDKALRHLKRVRFVTRYANQLQC